MAPVVSAFSPFLNGDCVDPFPGWEYRPFWGKTRSGNEPTRPLPSGSQNVSVCDLSESDSTGNSPSVDCHSVPQKTVCFPDQTQANRFGKQTTLTGPLENCRLGRQRLGNRSGNRGMSSLREEPPGSQPSAQKGQNPARAPAPGQKLEKTTGS